jgi:hypothetical protein
MSEKKDRYFLRRWKEVTKEEFVAAEREAGFHNTMGEPPNEPATSSFSGKGIEGRQGFLHVEPGHSSVIFQGHNVGEGR